MWDKLKGKKTIIGSVLGGVVVVAYSLGWITEQQAGVALGIVMSWTGVAIRMAIGGANAAERGK